MKKSVFILSLTLTIFVSTLSAQYKEFRVSTKGEGPPVLLIPGFTCTEKVWEDTIAELSKSYECHVFTLAGFGDVEPIAFPWLPKIKDALLRYINDKKLVKPVVIGHSLGGTLALWLATEKETWFKKLILVDALPSVGALMMPDFNSETIAYDNPYSKNILEMDEENFLAMAKQMASFMALNPEVHWQLTNWILKCDRKTYVHGYTDLLKVDLRDAISKINIPVTILASTHPNKEMMKLQYDKQFEKLPHKNILYANNSAHFIMYDQPEWFISTVISALKKDE
jgi:pimeloyl-ACP methyl ester carboxylesterase